MIPPLDVDEKIIGFVRKPFMDKILAILPNGDTYYLSFRDAETWLRLLGVSEEVDILSYVYNFYAAILDMMGPRIVGTTIELVSVAMENVRRQRELSHNEAIIR